MSLISRRNAIAVVFALLAPLGLAACSGDASDKAGSVVLTTPTWTGGQANVAVAKYLLETELGYDVTTKKGDEKATWRAVGTGKADAILEDWGHPGLEKKYVFKKKSVVSAGGIGVTGKIGWYVPEYLADKHPQITNWKKLNDFAPLFRTAKSGTRGQLLEGSPDFLTHDNAIIRNLKLNYKTVYAGSEKAQIARIKELARKRKPFITYWWRPHWLSSEARLKEVQLPAHYMRLRRQPQDGELRLPRDPAEEIPVRRLLQEGRQGREVPQELPVERGRPGRGRQDDRRGRALARRGGEEVGQGESGRLEGLALGAEGRVIPARKGRLIPAGQDA